MTNFEQDGVYSEVWQLGRDLQAQADEILRFAAHRDPAAPGTVTKIAERLQTQTDQYRGQRSFAEASTMLIPSPDGHAIGHGQTGGDIIGFSWTEYSRINPTTRVLEPEEHGVVMFLRVDAMNGVEDPGSAEDWRLNILPPGIGENAAIEGFVVGIPIIPDNKFAILTPGQTMPNTVTELLAQSAQDAQAQDYMEVVRRVDALTGRRAIFNQIVDRAIEETIGFELRVLNHRSRLLGQHVVIESDNLRIPNMKKPGTFLLAHGEYKGIFRKFVYAPYMENSELRAGVQAVIWNPEALPYVSQGRIPAQVIDNTNLAAFVPLTLPHTLRPDS